MGKNYFTDEQVELLKKNKYVKHVSNKSITYTLEFKNLFISEYGIKSATIIFEEAGLPKSILGYKRRSFFEVDLLTRENVQINFEDRRKESRNKGE